MSAWLRVSTLTAGLTHRTLAEIGGGGLYVSHTESDFYTQNSHHHTSLIYIYIGVEQH